MPEDRFAVNQSKPSGTVMFQREDQPHGSNETSANNRTKGGILTFWSSLITFLLSPPTCHASCFRTVAEIPLPFLMIRIHLKRHPLWRVAALVRNTSILFIPRTCSCVGTLVVHTLSISLESLSQLIFRADLVSH